MKMLLIIFLQIPFLFISGQMVTLHSKVLGEDRAIQIYTPEMGHFDGKPLPPCPVLYLLDGDVLTGLVASEIEYLSSAYYYLPPMIVVGVSNYAYDRMRDLTPTAPAGGFAGKGSSAYGGADRFMRFLTEEVMPYVEGRYHPSPFRILAGHSMGGLFSFYGLSRHVDSFNACIAISPSLWWDELASVREAVGRWRDDGIGAGHRFLFFSEANEGGGMHAGVHLLDSALGVQRPAGLTYRYVLYPDETHGTEPIRGMEDGLRWLFADWYPGIGDSTAALVSRWFERVSDRFGYVVKPPQWFVARRGSRVLAAGRVEDAIGFFVLNTRLYPDAAEVWRELGDAYAAKGDAKAAADCYRRAGR